MADPDPCPPDRSRALRAIAMTIVVVGACIGLARPLWLDEAFTVGALHQPGVNIVKDRGAVVLYYWLLRPWSLVSEAGWWLRLPSIAAAVGAVYLLHGWVRRFYGSRVAGVAAIYLALSWSVVEHAHEARPYALALLTTVGTWVLLTRWLETDDRRAYRLWLVLGAVAPLVHGLTVLQTAAQWLTVELSGFDRAHRWRARRAFAASAVVPGVLTLAGAGALTPYQPAATVTNVFRTFESLTGPGPAAVLIGAMAVLGARRLLTSSGARVDPLDAFRRVAPIVWASLPLVLLTLVSIVQPKLVPRYVLGSIGGVATLVAIGLTTLKPELLRRLALLTTAVILVVWQFEGHQAGTGDWRGAARHVAAEARPGDVIVFPRANRRPPFEAAWLDLEARPKVPVVNPSRPLSEVRWLEDDAPLTDVIADAHHYERLWIVVEPYTSVDREQPVVDGLEARGFEIVEHEEFGHQISVYLLVQRPRL